MFIIYICLQKSPWKILNQGELNIYQDLNYLGSLKKILKAMMPEEKLSIKLYQRFVSVN